MTTNIDSGDVEADARTQRILEHAEAERRAWGAAFGHLQPAEYAVAVASRRDAYSVELEALINAGHFDGPEAPPPPPETL
jgi:hypothetical protein